MKTYIFISTLVIFTITNLTAQEDRRQVQSKWDNVEYYPIDTTGFPLLALNVQGFYILADNSHKNYTIVSSLLISGNLFQFKSLRTGQPFLFKSPCEAEWMLIDSLKRCKGELMITIFPKGKKKSEEGIEIPLNKYRYDYCKNCKRAQRHYEKYGKQ